jgi:lipopolysaccharide/colanic/teichoic acid biosynthesis glycosyltransferase
MDFVDSILRTVFRYNLHFLGILVAAWAVAIEASFPYESVPQALELFFLVGACGISFFLLKGCGYFDILRPIPQLTDFLAVGVCVPLAAVAHVIFIRVFFGISVCPIQLATLVSIGVACTTFVAHILFQHALAKAGKKVKLVLHLLPQEREALIRVFKELDLLSSLQILEPVDLKEALLKADERAIDLIVISRDASSQFDREALLIRAHLAGVPITDYLRLMTTLPGRIHLDEMEQFSYIIGATPQTLLLRAFSSLKMITEPLVALLLGIVFLPILVAVGTIIKFTSPGPVFYRQVRTGYLGKNFTLVKFRSMRQDAEANGIQWAAKHDSRITPFGKFLRRTRLDELPQLWNVMRGEMGFVGPRPERPEIYQDLKREIPLFTLRTVVRPGITGWAQVYAGYASSIEQSRMKLEYDLYYIQNVSPRIDLHVILKTIQVACFGDAAEKREVVMGSQKSVAKGEVA